MLRRFHWQDDSFESHVVQETRALINSHHPIHTKVALLETAIEDEERQIADLEEQMLLATEHRRARILRIIEWRRRAIGHFRVTVKSLVVQIRGSESLHTYAIRTVGQDDTGGGFPFMEYSS